MEPVGIMTGPQLQQLRELIGVASPAVNGLWVRSMFRRTGRRSHRFLAGALFGVSLMLAWQYWGAA
jgi:hypothetical protein